MTRRLVAGVDSSTQSCKVVIRDADTGTLVRAGRAPHPDGTEIDPANWWTALQAAIANAGGLDDVAALAVGAQQHGMVCLDDTGTVIRRALLWNDLRSAEAADQLVVEGGGAQAWADAVGSVPVAAFTVTKLRWLAEHEPTAMARTATVCLPHDWLTSRLSADGRPWTDRGDASGTGYWSPATGKYRTDLLTLASGCRPELPPVLAPRAIGGHTVSGVALAAGTGDNAAAALGLAAGVGDVVVSIGTSGTVFGVSATPAADPSGAVAGFADATGQFLPLVCTLNAARVLSATASVLDVDLDRLSDLALAAPAGAGGLVMMPYLDGERVPNRPTATASLTGWTLRNSTPAHVARAAIEGMLCGLADGLDALTATGLPVRRVILIGGGARSAAVQQVASAVLGHPVAVPAPGEYVADGAARQAAWAVSDTATPPHWATSPSITIEAKSEPAIRERYHETCGTVAAG